jgi:PEP-CTERM motif
VLDPNHDQILFDLTRASTGNNAITGSFAYVDGGVVGPFTTYGTTADIFRGENFTRAEFQFLVPAPVPEPASLILLGTGLAALAVAGWRRSRRH